MSDANAAQSSEVLSRAANSATSSAVNCAGKARSNENHALHESRANPAKVAAKSVHAVNAANAQTEVRNLARRWTPPSRTLLWPTRQQWRLQWVVHQTPARIAHAVNAEKGVENAVAAMTDAVRCVTSQVMNHARAPVTSSLPSQRLALTRTPPPTPLYKAIQTSNAHHENAAAATAMVANGVTAARALNAAKTAMNRPF